MAVNNYTLNNGSLVIGDTTLNYGGADGSYWNGGNAAGLMVECDNYTEIVVHDNDTSLASFMYYDGIYNKLYTLYYTHYTLLLDTLYTLQVHTV